MLEHEEESKEKKLVRLLLQTIFLYQMIAFLSDNNVVQLLTLFRFFFWMCWLMLSIESFKQMSELIPRILYMANKLIGINEDALFLEWLVCVKYNHIY